MGYSRPLFSLFSSFQYSWLLTNVQNKIADDKFRTVDLWRWKQLLYQQSHNHCPQINILHFKNSTKYYNFEACLQVKMRYLQQ